MSQTGRSQVVRLPPAPTPPSSGTLRYATAQTWEITTVVPSAAQAPFDFTSGSSYVDDPDGVFAAHANVITIPSSWVAETGACIAIVTFGIMVNLDVRASATAGAALARMWVFSAYGSSSHQSIVMQDTRGYRDLQDADEATLTSSLKGSVQLDALSAGMVIEVDLHNEVTGTDLLVNQAILGTGYFSPCFLGIVKVADAV